MTKTSNLPLIEITQDTSPSSSSSLLDPATLAHLRNFFAPGRYTDIANKAGLSKSHVSKVIGGRSIPGLVVSSKLAKAAGVSIEVLKEYLDYLRANGNSNMTAYESRKLTHREGEEIRRDRKLGCRKLGERYGVSRQTISVYLRSLKGDKSNNKRDKGYE